MLVDPGRTQYDLNFRLFGVPVRVHPMFWLLCLLLGFTYLRFGDTPRFLIFTLCAIVSLLVHEFGHVGAMRYFGVRSSVLLYSFGGLAIPQGGSYRSRGEHIIVSLAGPAAGFLLFGIVHVLLFFSQIDWKQQGEYLYFAVDRLWLINLVWNCLNLIPVFPLDGGQVSKEVMCSISRRNGERNAYLLSFIIGAAAAIYGLLVYLGIDLLPWLPVGGLWTAILFGMLAYQSYVLYQHTQRRGSHWRSDDRLPWE